MEKYDNEMNQMLNQDNKTPTLMQELEIYVFGAAEGSLPQVMVPEGGSEAEAPVENLMVILFLLVNLITKRRYKWKQTNIQPLLSTLL